jgi:hypothetical protein
MIVRIVLYAVAALLLGAHFYRAGDFALVALCVATPFLFLHRRRVSLLLLQVAAYVGAAVWVDAAIRLVAVRQEAGRSWTAAALILGAVALVTVVAGALLNSEAIRSRYPARSADPGGSS